MNELIYITLSAVMLTLYERARRKDDKSRNSGLFIIGLLVVYVVIPTMIKGEDPRNIHILLALTILCYCLINMFYLTREMKKLNEGD